MKQNKKIYLLDSTLREGEQAANILFSLEEKLEISRKLQEFGVDIIEVGHPGISKSEEEICKIVCENILHCESLVHARACEKDILAAKNTKANWVGIWVSFNEISLDSKYTNKSMEWIKEQVIKSISYAKNLGLKIRFTIEDASRTSLEQISEIAHLAVFSGALRISLADTVGAWHPKDCYRIVEYAVQHFNCEIEVHLHNDLGLAHANAISAIEAGASVVDVSCLGIGERAGICDLFIMSTILNKHYGIEKYNLKQTAYLSQIISRMGSFQIEPHHPITGKDIFTHSSKYHVKAMEKNLMSYEFMSPSELNRERKISLKLIERSKSERHKNNLKISKPFLKGASELKYHRDGVGERWVLMDSRIDNRSPIYIIQRVFDRDYTQIYEPHVDSHSHYCDSIFVFMGNKENGKSLTVKVTINGESKIVESPASIYIPAFTSHDYSYVSGQGVYLNIVLAPNYNSSLC